MKKIYIYEPYVNFRCQKLRATMRKMAQSGNHWEITISINLLLEFPIGIHYIPPFFISPFTTYHSLLAKPFDHITNYTC